MKLPVPIPPGLMDDCLFWALCFVRYRSLRRIDPSSRGVLPSGVCVCVCVSLNVIRCNKKPLHPQWVDTRGQIKKSDTADDINEQGDKYPKTGGKRQKKKVLLESISILLTEEEDTRTGTHSKWRTDVWTGLQPLVKMRKQNVLVWLTTNCDFQHSCPEATCPERMQGCRSYVQVASVAFLALTLQPYVYTIYCSQLLSLFHVSRHAAVSVRCRNTRNAALTRTFLDTQHVTIYQRQSYQHNGRTMCQTPANAHNIRAPGGVRILTDRAYATSWML